MPAKAELNPRMAQTISPRLRGDGDKQQVARQFEALFITQLLKSAHAAALADDPLAGDTTFRDFQDENRAQALAAAAPLGVAKLLGGEL